MQLILRKGSWGLGGRVPNANDPSYHCSNAATFMKSMKALGGWQRARLTNSAKAIPFKTLRQSHQDRLYLIVFVVAEKQRGDSKVPAGFAQQWKTMMSSYCFKIWQLSRAYLNGPIDLQNPSLDI